MAPHSSTLAWKVPWMEEPGRLQSMGSLRVRHDWVTSLSLFTFMPWRRKWQPLQCSCLENPRDGGAWWAAVYGVAQSRIQLKRLSSSSSSKSHMALQSSYTSPGWLTSRHKIKAFFFFLSLFKLMFHFLFIQVSVPFNWIQNKNKHKNNLLSHGIIVALM